MGSLRDCICSVGAAPTHEHHREGHSRDDEAASVRDGLLKRREISEPHESQRSRIGKASRIVADSRCFWCEVKLVNVGQHGFPHAELSAHLFEHLRRDGDGASRHGLRQVRLLCSFNVILGRARAVSMITGMDFRHGR